MAEPFKERIDERAVHALMGQLAAAEPRFLREAATDAALSGLTELELKPRIAHVADAVAAGFASVSWHDQAEAAALAAESGSHDGQLDTFRAWPLARFIEVGGLDDMPSSFAALERITPVASAEFAIRPFIERYRELAMNHVLEWTGHPDEHVRRLASEGTRPLLPWAPRIAWLGEQPRATEPILDRLLSDSSPYVRRSVANHLGDLAKLDIERALALAGSWVDRDESSAAIVRHGLRHAVKAGNAEALRLVGVRAGLALGSASIEVTTPMVQVGGAAAFRARIEVLEPGLVLIDYVIHHRDARGALRPKVFKLTRRQLKQPGVIELVREHSFRKVTVRTYRPGTHRVELQVNGRVVCGCDFELTDRQDGRGG